MFGKNLIEFILEAKGESDSGFYRLPARIPSPGNGTPSRSGGSMSRKIEPWVRVPVFRCHNQTYFYSSGGIGCWGTDAG